MKTFLEFLIEEPLLNEISKGALVRYIDLAGQQTSSDKSLVPAFRMKRALGMYNAWKRIRPETRRQPLRRRKYARKTPEAVTADTELDT